MTARQLRFDEQTLDALLATVDVGDQEFSSALTLALQLLNTGDSEMRATLALITILSDETLAGVIRDALPPDAVVPRPSVVHPGSAGRRLVCLQLALERAKRDLACADRIDNDARWQRETAECSAHVRAIEVEIGKLIEEARR